MVTRQNKDIKRENKKCEKNNLPDLPQEFFAEFLKLPSCKSRGFCDNCGRCEH